jgi:hypothetical protein
LFVSLGFFSCSEEPIDPELNEVIGQDLVAPPAPSFSFKAEIDGVLFEADEALASLVDLPSFGEPRLSIIGVDGSTSQTLSLSVETNQAGNFPLEFMSSVIVLLNASNPSDKNSFSSTTIGNPIIGNINIANLDINENKVSGTFEGTLYTIDTDETRVITNGVFTTVPLVAP